MFLMQVAYYVTTPSMVISAIGLKAFLFKQISYITNLALKKIFHSDTCERSALRLIEKSPIFMQRSIQLLNGKNAVIAGSVLLIGSYLNRNVFKNNVVNHSPTMDKLLEKFVPFINSRNETEQQMFHLKRIDLNPNSADAYYILALTLFKGASIRLLNGEKMTQQQLYLKSIDLNPNDAYVYNNLAATLPEGASIRLLNGEKMTQQQLYLKSIDLNPNDAYVYNKLAATLPKGASITLPNGKKMTRQELYLQGKRL